MNSPRRLLRRLGVRRPQYPGVAGWAKQVPKPPPCPPGWQVGPPDFVVVGAQKAGTTWWFHLIAAHPSVHHDPKQRPELHYWDRFSHSWPEPADIELYHRLFARPAGMKAGEKTPEYMMDYWVPPMLHEAAPEARVIVLLRDPIDRYRSASAHGWERGWIRDRLTETSIFDAGLYHSQLGRLRDTFGPDQLLVLQYERCVREPQTQLSRTYEFLGLPDHELSEEQLRQPRNPTRRQAPPLDARRRASLLAAYAADVRLVRDALPDIDLALWPNFAQLD